MFSIGINRYSEWCPLQGPVVDQDALCEILSASYGFAAERMICLRDEAASAAAIIQKFKSFSDLHHKDRLVVAYSGHGHTDPFDDMGYWIASNGSRDTDARNNWIPNAQLRNIFARLPVKNILVICDSCFSGDLLDQDRDLAPMSPASIELADSLTSREVLTSGSSEKVKDVEVGGHSPFMYHLLDSLRRAENWTDPVRLWDRLRTGVRGQQPIYGDLGKASGHQKGGGFILRREERRDVTKLKAEREARLSELERAEAEQREARREREAEESQRESALAAMDARIKELEGRLSHGGGSGETLQEIFEAVQERKHQAHELEAERKRQEEAERQRQEHIAALRNKELDQKKEQIAGDLRTFEAIENSLHATDDLRRAAWRKLCETYGAGEVAYEAGIRLTVDLNQGVQVFRPFLSRGRDVTLTLPGELKLELKWIEPGRFLMGSPAGEKDRSDDEELHEVTLTKGFWLGVYPVTQGQWQTVMGNNPSHCKKSGLEAPVERVSWEDAVAFCRELTEREREAGRLPMGYEYGLPTEAQWEYACRAGTTTAFCYGDTLSGGEANFNGKHPYGGGRKGEYLEKTVKVGSYGPNAWGLHDMHGNVWEWCHDWMGECPKGEVIDPTGPPSGQVRVLRGGSWSGRARGCRSAFRGGCDPSRRGRNSGFRLSLQVQTCQKQ